MNNNVHGIDHIGLTVPDLDAATEFFINALNASVIYDTYLKSQPPRHAVATQKRLGISSDTAEIAIRMIGFPNGAQIELFEFSGQNRSGPVTPADYGWQHVAFYVDDIELAVRQIEAAGGKRNADPIDLTGIEAGAGNKFCYCLTPWGSSIEVITYPTPQPYLHTSKRRKWSV
ncbi:VOC family protein [Citrobacter sp. JGM124]|uniref:VOC family protein n=1 Tax=Citrobacter sp. JGM124 TaxID=2799789 RepID=UPI001BA7C5B1|nr:VOC family protein [Citrobacter sp. JGM124]MBS0847014.1 VOC family protein [Citrobacter sp. JGM124]